jgi:hypothetical protein
MASKKRKRVTTVTVYEASSVDLTKRASGNSLAIEVRSGNELLGKLVMGRGSVQWWPNGNKTNAYKKPWPQFARLLETAMAKK